MINPQFPHTLAEWFAITEITLLKADPAGYLSVLPLYYPAIYQAMY